MYKYTKIIPNSTKIHVIELKNPISAAFPMLSKMLVVAFAITAYTNICRNGSSFPIIRPMLLPQTAKTKLPKDNSAYEENIDLVKTLQPGGPKYNSFGFLKLTDGKLYTCNGSDFDNKKKHAYRCSTPMMSGSYIPQKE